MMPDNPITIFCPRCDRSYTGKSVTVWEKLKHHVSEQHPDHDPNWADDE